MKKAGWLAIASVGIIAVFLWWYFIVPPCAGECGPRFGSDEATPSNPADTACWPLLPDQCKDEKPTSAKSVEELAVNAAPAAGSELMVIKRPFKEITVYPGIHLGDNLNDVKEKLNRLEIPLKDYGYELNYR
ncbi:MAG: hypothetical protein ACREJQ_06960, partial [bacterium]